LLAIRHFLRPVTQQAAKVNEWITEGGHVPVEDGADGVGLVSLELAVIEFQVSVDNAHTLGLGDILQEAVHQSVHVLVFFDFGEAPALGPAL